VRRILTINGESTEANRWAHESVPALDFTCVTKFNIIDPYSCLGNSAWGINNNGQAAGSFFED
jgi:hypothetical protein